MWTLVWLEQLLQDFRFALRTLRKNPGFTLTAVLILALGISANIIVFGVLQAFVLRPLDVPHGKQVMTLARKNQTYPIFSYSEVRDVRDKNKAFSAVAAFNIADFGLEADGATRPAWGCEVSVQYFDVVGIKPFLGRLLQPSDDDHPGASDAAVLSWVAWKNDFGADGNIVGKAIRIDKHPYTIVGVTPEGFNGTERFLQPGVFVPMANEASLEGVDWLESRTETHPWAIVRIKDGITMPQVQADLDAIATRVTQQYPKEEEGLGFKLTRPGLAGDFIGGPVRGFLAGVMALAGIVLLAACANLGSLFAARTADRARARQILATALGRMLILLASGSVVGLVLGAAASRLLAAIVYQASAQDPFVLAVVRFTMLLTGSLAVAGPVRRALRINPPTLLREQ